MPKRHRIDRLKKLPNSKDEIIENLFGSISNESIRKYTDLKDDYLVLALPKSESIPTRLLELRYHKLKEAIGDTIQKSSLREQALQRLLKAYDNLLQSPSPNKRRRTQSSFTKEDLDLDDIDESEDDESFEELIDLYQDQDQDSNRDRDSYQDQDQDQDILYISEDEKSLVGQDELDDINDKVQLNSSIDMALQDDDEAKRSSPKPTVVKGKSSVTKEAMKLKKPEKPTRRGREREKPVNKAFTKEDLTKEILEAQIAADLRMGDTTTTAGGDVVMEEGAPGAPPPRSTLTPAPAPAASSMEITRPKSVREEQKAQNKLRLAQNRLMNEIQKQIRKKTKGTGKVILDQIQKQFPKAKKEPVSSKMHEGFDDGQMKGLRDLLSTRKVRDSLPEQTQTQGKTTKTRRTDNQETETQRAMREIKFHEEGKRTKIDQELTEHILQGASDATLDHADETNIRVSVDPTVAPSPGPGLDPGRGASTDPGPPAPPDSSNVGNEMEVTSSMVVNNSRNYNYRNRFGHIGENLDVFMPQILSNRKKEKIHVSRSKKFRKLECPSDASDCESLPGDYNLRAKQSRHWKDQKYRLPDWKS